MITLILLIFIIAVVAAFRLNELRSLSRFFPGVSKHLSCPGNRAFTSGRHHCGYVRLKRFKKRSSDTDQSKLSLKRNNEIDSGECAYGQRLYEIYCSRGDSTGMHTTPAAPSVCNITDPGAWAKKSATQLDKIIFDSTKNPSIVLALASSRPGLLRDSRKTHGVSREDSPCHHHPARSPSRSATVAGRLFRNYVQKSNVPIPTTGLAYGILQRGRSLSSAS